MVELLEEPGSKLIVLGASTTVKLGALTVKAVGAEADRLPEVPVMLTLTVPEVAVPLAAKVSVVAPVAGFGEKEAVTPAGRPVAARLTWPLNPYCEFR